MMDRWEASPVRVQYPARGETRYSLTEKCANWSIDKLLLNLCFKKDHLESYRPLRRSIKTSPQKKSKISSEVKGISSAHIGSAVLSPTNQSMAASSIRIGRPPKQMNWSIWKTWGRSSSSILSRMRAYVSSRVEGSEDRVLCKAFLERHFKIARSWSATQRNLTKG